MMLRVQELVVYPIKSAHGISVERAVVETRGLRHDRRWLVVEPDGMALTQRDEPRLALLRPRIESVSPQATPAAHTAPRAATSEGLVVEAPGRPPLRLRTDPHGERLTSWVWESRIAALCAGREADEWVTDFLGRPARLVYMDERAERRVQAPGTEGERSVSFADELPVLVTTQSSLDDLNRRLVTPVSMARFRPNLVISGASPFAEDQWSRIEVGDHALEVIKPAGRCVVTTLDQDTAERDAGSEPLATLASFRRRSGGRYTDAPGSVYFGVRAAPLCTGALRVGDQVRAFPRVTDG